MSKPTFDIKITLPAIHKGKAVPALESLSNLKDLDDDIEVHYSDEGGPHAFVDGTSSDEMGGAGLRVDFYPSDTPESFEAAVREKARILGDMLG